MKAQQELDYARIEAAIAFIRQRYRDQPSLEEIAAHVNLSPYHFQRMFRRWAGVSPKQFVQYLSVEHAKRILRQTRATLLDATCEVGLSGTGRLHDLFVSIEGMTPGEYKNGGEALSINYSFAPTPFGEVIIASTDKGICHLAFTTGGCGEALERLKADFPNAAYAEATDTHQQNALSVFGRDRGGPEEVRLHLKATGFRLKVWEALLRVPGGGLTSYSDLAREAGSGGAQRAVGTAVGANPVALLIPCHRVIRATGEFGNYHWGEDKKAAIIAWEASSRQ